MKSGWWGGGSRGRFRDDCNGREQAGQPVMPVKAEVVEQIAGLRERIRYHEHRYYMLDAPEIADGSSTNSSRSSMNSRRPIPS